MSIKELQQKLDEMTADRDRLQRVIDSRPAINQSLPESYIKWSQGIYQMESTHILERMQ